ncbi:MAG: fasciclin domain-containing protein [Filomicrobium sp.]
MSKTKIGFIALAAGLIAAPALASQSYPTVLQQAENTGQFTTFLKAVEAAGMTSVLNGDQPVTVFAPTDDAFAKVPKEKLAELMKPENKGKLAKVLKKHIIKGEVWGSSIANEQISLTTKAEKSLNADGSQWPFSFGDATIVQLNLMGSNGKIHAIDQVKGLASAS